MEDWLNCMLKVVTFNTVEPVTFKDTQCLKTSFLQGTHVSMQTKELIRNQLMT